MDTKEQLLEVRDIARRLESILLELEPQPVCSVCGQALICAHCEGRKGGCKASQMSTSEQRQENGRKGGRPRKQKVIVDPVTSASVPGTFSPVPKAQSANSPDYLSIEPAKYYKTEEVAHEHQTSLRDVGTGGLDVENKSRAPVEAELFLLTSLFIELIDQLLQ